MASSSHVNPSLFTPQLSTTTQSLGSSARKGIYLPFNKAISRLPEALQPKNEHEQDQIAMVLSHLDQLHTTRANVAGGLSAKTISDYVWSLLKHTTKISRGALSTTSNDTPEPPEELPPMTGSIASEIACNVINGVDSHDTTLAVLRILQKFPWETKVALAATTYTLTFGDFGFNLCAKSKVSRYNLPDFVELLLFKITDVIVEFEKLSTLYMTSKNPIAKAARTHFVVATYWIVKAIVASSASNIKAISTRSRKMDKNSSSLWSGKLELIHGYLGRSFFQLRELLVPKIEENLDYEAYRKIVKTFKHEDYSGNRKALNALFAANVEALILYDGMAKRRVNLTELEGKYVLLLISGLGINQELDIMKMIYAELTQKNQYKLVWIPIVDGSLQISNTAKSVFEKLRSFMPWYSIDNPSMVTYAAIEFFTNDWNFGREPIIVALDPRGKVNKNVLPMMLIWGNHAFPFTNTRDKTLWEQESWRLELLFDSNHHIEPKISRWIRADKYIFVYGGENVEWIQKFEKIAYEVAHEGLIPMEIIYVGGSHIEESLQQVCESIDHDDEELVGHRLIDPRKTWYFWKRLESMKDSMIQYRKFNFLFQEIQRLHNYDKSNVEWAILAKGSRILVNGHGQVALSTLEAYPVWKDKSMGVEGFGVGFQSHYRKLHRKKFPCERIEFSTNNTLEVIPSTSKSIRCPSCHNQMQRCVALLCYHDN